jgi:hypothetical protein
LCLLHATLQLKRVFAGSSNKEIAAQLNISEASVKSALQQLFIKTAVRTRIQLFRVALEEYGTAWRLQQTIMTSARDNHESNRRSSSESPQSPKDTTRRPVSVPGIRRSLPGFPAASPLLVFRTRLARA